jgi:hypothetical protein
MGLTVINKATGEKVGVVCYLSIVPAHRRIEIGGLWYVCVRVCVVYDHTPCTS